MLFQRNNKSEKGRQEKKNNSTSNKSKMYTPLQKSKQKRNYFMNMDKLKIFPIITVLIILVILLIFITVKATIDIEKNSTSPIFLRQKRSKMPTQAFNENEILSSKEITHLIIVAGHSVTLPTTHLIDAATDERDWYLLDYQKNKGLPQVIIRHIQAGIDEAARDSEHSLLLFSGGQTRKSTGPISEGISYFRMADLLNLWDTNIQEENSKNTVRARSAIEEYATDSFQNLLFSICRFYEITKNYPTKISVVSYTFKQRRFESMHCKALQFPKENFHFIGVDPPNSSNFDLEQATKGEFENAAKPFEEDPYGCFTDVLKQKRMERNPFFRTPPYELTCPELKELLNWCGPDYFSKDRLPWSYL